MIPIENVYYLLSYAWRDLHHFPLSHRSAESFDSIADILVHTLAVRTERIIKRGLERNYAEADEVIAGVKGRLDVTQTVSRLLHVQAKAHCAFDQFHHDILANQLIKAVLRKALKVPELNVGVRDRARSVVLHLREIADIQPRDVDFSRLPARFNNRDYPFALQLARLINRFLIVNEEDGTVRYHDFTDDEREMARIFEEFLFGFYTWEHAAKVDRRHIPWFRVHASEHDQRFLPNMRTDVVLETSDRILIIDAKYYREALKGWHGTERVRSSNLYQILSYVHNLQPNIATKPVEGMLVYPVVNAPFSFDFKLDGRSIKVRSIDLNQPWTRVHGDLLGLVA